MSTINDSASLSVAEKRFSDRVCERYLLTMKSGGIVALLELISELGHSDEMYSTYHFGDGDTDPDGLFWVPRRDAHKLCRDAFLLVVRLSWFPVNGGEYYIQLDWLKGDSDNSIIVDTDDGEKLLNDFSPESEYITRVI